MKTPTSSDVIARDCIAVRMRLLNRVVANLYDDALSPLALKASQLNILVAAAKFGVARPANRSNRRVSHAQRNKDNSASNTSR